MKGIEYRVLLLVRGFVEIVAIARIRAMRFSPALLLGASIEAVTAVDAVAGVVEVVRVGLVSEGFVDSV